MSIRILKKNRKVFGSNKSNISGKSEILITYDNQIYYIGVDVQPKLWVIHKVYMLEETPDPKEIQTRLDWYSQHYHYRQLNLAESRSELKKIKFFLSLFFNAMTMTTLAKFPDVYTEGCLHPDLLQLYWRLNNRSL